MAQESAPYIALYRDDQGFAYSIVSRNHSMMSGHYATPEEMTEIILRLPSVFSGMTFAIKNIVPNDALPGQHPRTLDLNDLEKILKK